MAGEENCGATDAAGPSTGSVPAVSGRSYAAAVAAPPRRPDLAPYDASTTWQPWAAIGAVVLIAALTTVIAIGGGLLAAAGPDEGGTGTTSGATLIAILLAQMTMLAGAVMAARAYGNRLTSALALKPPAGGFRSYAWSLSIVLGAVAAYTAVTHLLFAHDLSEDLSTMTSIFRGPWWPLALIVIGVGAPLSEELLFRGFLQTALVPTRLGYRGASVVTTTLWTALHAGYSVSGLLEVFMIGMLFCLILRRTGSLRVPLACHAIYNSGIAAILILTPKEVLGF